jgi:hypothetical protein
MDEICRACIKHGKTINTLKELKGGNNHFRVLDIHGKIILKYI